MKRRPPIKKSLPVLLLALLIALGYISRTHIPVHAPIEKPVPVSNSFSEGELARVLNVHDGDTVNIFYKGEKYRVRLIGIDAPELKQGPWGIRAREHLKEIIQKEGGQVQVELDVQTNDRYGRLLAYLRGADGTLINKEMIEDGYAVLLTVPPDIKHVDEFRSAQREARDEGRGFWSEGGLRESPSEFRKRTR